MNSNNAIYTLHNGELKPSTEPLFTAQNRAFRYGDSFFESMRLIDNRIHLADYHAERLADTAAILNMDAMQLTENAISQHVAELAAANKWQGNARLRLSVYRGGGGLYSPETNKAEWVLSGQEMEHNTFKLNDRGIIAAIYPHERKYAATRMARCKTGSSLLNVLAANYRLQNNLDDAIILNHEGSLCETTIANIFVLYNDILYTPALSDGCVAGVMRRHIIKLASENGYQIMEATLHPDLLKEATEVFVTNALSINWVMGFDGQRYFNRTCRRLVQLLNDNITAGQESAE